MNSRYPIMITVLIVLLMMPAYPAEGFTQIFGDLDSTEQAVEFSGSISSHFSYLPGYDNLIEPNAALEGGLEFTSSDFAGNVDFSLGSDLSEDFVISDILQNLSLTWFFPRGNFKAGYMVQQWGVTDTYRVTDIINAVDLSDGLSMDTRKMKLPEMMGIAQWFFDTSSLQLIYKPVFHPTWTGNENSRWTIEADQESFVITDDTQMIKENTSTFSYASYAVRLALSSMNLETHLFFHHGYDYQGGYVYSLSAPVSPDPRAVVDSIETIYTRFNTFGADARYVVGPMTVAAEGAFFLSEDADGTDETLYNSRFAYGASLMYLFKNSSSSITAGYYGSHILGYDNTEVMDVDTMTYVETDHNLTLAFLLSMLNEQLRFEGAFTYQFPTTGYAFLTEITYFATDEIGVTAGMELIGSFDSEISSSYAYWDKNDRLYLSISYLF
ncbi:MAG: hypothetical protein PQJ35_00110 [Sphaerochaetaceae bacterium]|nr:hypothetical protein [Sphaerochaetaceae bacterium]